MFVLVFEKKKNLPCLELFCGWFKSKQTCNKRNDYTNSPFDGDVFLSHHKRGKCLFDVVGNYLISLFRNDNLNQTNFVYHINFLIQSISRIYLQSLIWIQLNNVPLVPFSALLSLSQLFPIGLLYFQNLPKFLSWIKMRWGSLSYY